MQATGLWRGSTPQKLRLVSGLILFAFAATHFLNHALGLVSLGAMNDFEAMRVIVTRSWLGSAVLLAALLIHAGLGLWTVFRRRTWVMPLWEYVQLATGVGIPVLLLPHIVNARGAAVLFGVQTTYTYELARIWTATIADQSMLLFFVWVHGCIGLHYWLRLWPQYRLIRPLLYGVAVLMPFAALAGVSVQGRAIAQVMASKAGAAALKASVGWPSDAGAATIAAIREDLRAAYVLAALVTAAILAGGVLLLGRQRRIPVRYVGGPLVRSDPGATVLEISRRNNLPHVSVCGGRGRCSTCRILVMNQGAGIAPADEAEMKTLKAIGAGPHVRLACRAVPIGDVTVLPLLKSAPGLNEGRRGVTVDEGVERELAVLFVDLRGFTSLTERKLPFDIIYILNQFFSAIGKPIGDFGGWISNYAGDGVIALFENDSGIAAACRAAMLATIEIDRAMTLLSYRLLEETRTPLRVAMGLHAGPHVMGRVGFGAVQPVSVVGLAVNVASRLETLAKQNGVQLALSATVANFGGLDSKGLRIAPIDVRGLSEPLDVIFVPSAGDLVPRLGRSLDAPTELAMPAAP